MAYCNYKLLYSIAIYNTGTQHAIQYVINFYVCGQVKAKTSAIAKLQVRVYMCNGSKYYFKLVIIQLPYSY